MPQPQALDPPVPAPSATSDASPAEPDARRLDSRTLLGNERELVIHHNGELYRLRLTRAGKLILTK